MTHKPMPIREAFKNLKVSHVTGYRLVDDGTLKSYKIGRRRYTTEKYIQECIETLTARTMSGGKKRGAA